MSEDPVLAKPFAPAIEGPAWVFSSQEQNAVSGVSVVWLSGTHGTLRIPFGMRLRRKGGPSKYALAFE